MYKLFKTDLFFRPKTKSDTEVKATTVDTDTLIATCKHFNTTVQQTIKQLNEFSDFTKALEVRKIQSKKTENLNYLIMDVCFDLYLKALNPLQQGYLLQIDFLDRTYFFDKDNLVVDAEGCDEDDTCPTLDLSHCFAKFRDISLIELTHIDLIK